MTCAAKHTRTAEHTTDCADAPAPALRCRILPFLDQGGACGAAGPASAPPLCLGGPRGARRATPGPRRPGGSTITQAPGGLRSRRGARSVLVLPGGAHAAPDRTPCRKAVEPPGRRVRPRPIGSKGPQQLTLAVFPCQAHPRAGNFRRSGRPPGRRAALACLSHGLRTRWHVPARCTRGRWRCPAWPARPGRQPGGKGEFA